MQVHLMTVDVSPIKLPSDSGEIKGLSPFRNRKQTVSLLFLFPEEAGSLRAHK